MVIIFSKKLNFWKYIHHRWKSHFHTWKWVVL